MTRRPRESHTHLIGIGGIGMSALAQVLAARGERLSGCDLHPSPLTAKLQRLGIRFSAGHDPAHLAGASRVVVSDAIKPDNPEYRRAGALGLPRLRRSKVVGELMRERRGIAVAGTHGKTTTTAMIGFILAEAGLDPTVLVGGELSAFGGNARVGHSQFFVAEACEAYESFLDLAPEIAVVTNVEAEHLDHHRTEAALIECFAAFLRQVRPGGRVIYCADDNNASALAARAPVGAVSYALGGDADFRASEVANDGLGMSFTLVHAGGRARVRLLIPGPHNVANAAAAIAACSVAGVGVEQSVAALASYAGVARRFQVTLTADGVTVVDDYAHHPTEIRAVIGAARARCRGRVVVVFQPHLYSRTRDFLDGFAEALALADQVIVADIYAAREQPIAGVTGDSIVSAMRARHKQEASFVPQKEQVPQMLARSLAAGDWVLVLGAGDIGSVADDLAAALGGAAPGAVAQGRARCTG
jgi:UDP-N-acetylmuramate--alanine ligase